MCVTLTNLGRVHWRMTSTITQQCCSKTFQLAYASRQHCNTSLQNKGLKSQPGATAPQPMLQPPTHRRPHGNVYKTNSGLSALQMCTELNEHCWRQKGWTRRQLWPGQRLGIGVQTKPCRAQHLPCTCTIPAGPHIYRLAAHDILSMNMLSYTAPHHLAVLQHTTLRSMTALAATLGLVLVQYYM